MTDAMKPFSVADRMFWWVRFWTAVLVVAGMGLAGVQWGLTRVSIEELQALDKAKEEKVDAKEARARIERRIDEQIAVVGNVRDNLLIMMERQRLEPKPLPSPMPRIMSEPQP